MCKGAISLWFGIFADIRRERLRKSKKGVRLNSRVSVRDLKPWPAEYDSTAQSNLRWRSEISYPSWPLCHSNTHITHSVNKQTKQHELERYG